MPPLLVSLKNQGLVKAPTETADSGAHVGQAFISASGISLANQIKANAHEQRISTGRAGERFHVIATLVDAYLEDDSEFQVRWSLGDPNPTITHHPGLNEPFSPAWSHVDALVREGMLYFTGSKSHGSIGVPTWVMSSYESNDRNAVGMPPGPHRISALAHSHVTYNMTNNNTNIHGGQVNIAQQSHDFSQTNQGIQPGDLHGLIAALRELSVPPESIESLEEDLHAAGDDIETRRRSAMAWLADFTSQVASGALGGALGDSIPLPLITSLIWSYLNVG